MSGNRRKYERKKVGFGWTILIFGLCLQLTDDVEGDEECAGAFDGPSTSGWRRQSFQDIDECIDVSVREKNCNCKWSVEFLDFFFSLPTIQKL